MHAEPFRAVAARLRVGPALAERRRRRRCRRGAGLNRVVDASRGPLALPPEGIVLSTALADAAARAARRAA